MANNNNNLKAEAAIVEAIKLGKELLAQGVEFPRSEVPDKSHKNKNSPISRE